MRWGLKLALISLTFILAACQTPAGAHELTATPTLAVTPAPPLPSPTPTPTRSPLPDLNLELANHLGVGWQRADIAWSPDSRNFVVTYWAGWLAQSFLVDGRTGEAVDLMTEDGFDVGLAAWSPDGKKLAAIAGNDMDTARRSVWLFAGGRKIRLLEGACEDLTWSPDSLTLLATCELYDWRGAPPPLDQTSNPATISQQGGVWGGGQLWLMEAREQALPRRLLDLVQMPLVTFGAGTRFDTARNPHWAGDKIAFEVRSEDKALALKLGIAIVSADGSSPRLVTTKPVWLVGWLPDGKLLVRSNIYAGQILQYTDDLYALDPATGLVENLTRVDLRCDPLQSLRCQGASRQILTTPGYAALAPDGRRFYYRATSRSDVIGSQARVDWLVVGTYPPGELTREYSTTYQEPTGPRLLYPTWLNSGQLAYLETTGYDPQTWSAPGGNVTVRFMIDGRPVRQEEVGTWGVFAAAWSPDGSRVAVANDFGVILYGLLP